MPDEKDHRVDEELASAEMFAVNTLDSLPKIRALALCGVLLLAGTFRTSQQIILAALLKPVLKKRLSATGDNLPNVIQYLKEQHEDRLDEILRNYPAGCRNWKKWMPN